MNKENTEQLFNDFPELFKHCTDMQQSLMVFGFECSDGWYDLIYKLCGDIKESYCGVVPDDFWVVQVKEKFGGLRFYVGYATQKVHDLIHTAEDDSFYICEHCGKVNPRRVVGKRYKSFYRDKLPWIMTLCDGCLKKHLVEHKMKQGDYVSGWQKKQCAPFIIMSH